MLLSFHFLMNFLLCRNLFFCSLLTDLSHHDFFPLWSLEVCLYSEKKIPTVSIFKVFFF